MELLGYSEFKKTVEEQLEKYLPEGYGVRTDQVTGNNKAWDDIIMYQRGEESQNGAKVNIGIRISHLYEGYVDSQGDLESVLMGAAEFLVEKKPYQARNTKKCDGCGGYEVQYHMLSGQYEGKCGSAVRNTPQGTIRFVDCLPLAPYSNLQPIRRRQVDGTSGHGGGSALCTCP